MTCLKRNLDFKLCNNCNMFTVSSLATCLSSVLKTPAKRVIRWLLQRQAFWLSHCSHCWCPGTLYGGSCKLISLFRCSRLTRHHYGIVSVLHAFPHMEHFKNLPATVREMESNSFSNHQHLKSSRISGLTWIYISAQKIFLSNFDMQAPRSLREES